MSYSAKKKNYFISVGIPKQQTQGIVSLLSLLYDAE